MRVLACILLAAMAAAPALSQTAPPDSSAGRAGGLLSAIASADSAATDSLAVEPAASGYFGVWSRSAAFTMDADVSIISGKLDLSANNSDSDVGSDAAYSRRTNEFRRQDRESTQTNLKTGVSGVIPSIGDLRLDLNRQTVDDETRVPTVGQSGADSTLIFLVEDEVNDARLGLSGTQELGGPFELGWGVRGAYLDREGSNRGTVQASDRFERGGSSRWSYAQGPAKVVAKFGYAALDGSNTLRGSEGDLSARQDTVGTRLSVNLGNRLNFDVDVDRSSFDEKRLDFRRNSTGVVDTLGVDAEDRVDRERERSITDRFNMNVRSQVLPILSLSTSFTHSFNDREFSFSEEGRVKDSRSNLRNTLILDYLDSGSATLGFNYGNRWFDRKSRSETSFRGKKFNKSYELKLTINQELMEALSLRVTLSQDLTQSIPTDETDNDNSDRFAEVADGQLVADPFENLTLTVNGTIRRTDSINLSENLVGENREDRLYDVRGGYEWGVLRGLTLEQVYRMEILFKNFHATDDRDQFNKSGHLSSTVAWSMLGSDGKAADPTKPSIELKHEVDFDENGRRDPVFDPFGSVYVRSLRRFDHLFRGQVLVPWKGLTGSILSEHGVIQEKNPSTGAAKEDKDYGAVRYRLSGNRTFRRGLASVRLDVSRVIQYGDRIREEQQRFWEAASTVTVNF